MKNNKHQDSLNRLLKRIMRNINEESDGFSLDPVDREYPRETGLKGVFGKYTEQVPNDVIRYIRKNPRLIFDRLYAEYGDKAYEYLDMSKAKRFKNY